MMQHSVTAIARSSRPEEFLGKGVLKNVANLQENAYCFIFSQFQPGAACKSVSYKKSRVAY